MAREIEGSEKGDYFFSLEGLTREDEAVEGPALEMIDSRYGLLTCRLGQRGAWQSRTRLFFAVDTYRILFKRVRSWD